MHLMNLAKLSVKKEISITKNFSIIYEFTSIHAKSCSDNITKIYMYKYIYKKNYMIT